MVSKMISKSRLFVDILGPSPKEPSREAKWSPRGAKRLRKLIQKEVHRGSKWNINACILETLRSIFFVDGGQAEKDVGFSPKNKRLQPSSKNRFSSQCKLPSWKLLPKIASFCVISESCGGSKRKSLTMGALAPICASSIYIYIYICIITI